MLKQILIYSLFFSQNSYAQPNPVVVIETTRKFVSELPAFPTGKVFVINNERFKGYSLEEIKKLLLIDNSARSFEIQLFKYRKLLSDYDILTNTLTIKSKLQENDIVLLKKNADRLTKKWTEENRLRHLAENKPNFGNWIAWSCAGVTTATALILGTVLIAK